jgi:hypothetical protein
MSGERAAQSCDRMPAECGNELCRCEQQEATAQRRALANAQSTLAEETFVNRARLGLKARCSSDEWHRSEADSVECEAAVQSRAELRYGSQQTQQVEAAEARSHDRSRVI